mmetsp:Transcript_54720/g.127936  ORF Transcript_54720/g.127936 Transcript_54720/m.127936 type:complete len:212 (-) Transcript_54720:423-1058(-)
MPLTSFTSASSSKYPRSRSASSSSSSSSGLSSPCPPPQSSRSSSSSYSSSSSCSCSSSSCSTLSGKLASFSPIAINRSAARIKFCSCAFNPPRYSSPLPFGIISRPIRSTSWASDSSSIAASSYSSILRAIPSSPSSSLAESSYSSNPPAFSSDSARKASIERWPCCSAASSPMSLSSSCMYRIAFIISSNSRAFSAIEPAALVGSTTAWS